MNLADQWNKLSGRFNYFTSQKSSSSDERKEGVWPIFINFIKQNIHHASGLKALDFGCGTGMFCLDLQKLGFDVTGIDISTDMISIGQENLPNTIKLLVGNGETAREASDKNGKFDLIVSGMVLQFIDTDEIAQLAKSLSSGGFLIFANHNPAHLNNRNVTDTLKIAGTDFVFPIYRRNTEEYDRIFSQYGHTRVFEEYSAPVLLSADSAIPKYVILGYRKL